MRRQALAPLKALLLDAPPDAAFAVDEVFARTALERLAAEEGARLVDWGAVADAASRGFAWCGIWIPLCLICVRIGAGREAFALPGLHSPGVDDLFPA